MAAQWFQQTVTVLSWIIFPFQLLFFVLIWALSWLLAPLTWLIRSILQVMMAPIRFLAKFEVKTMPCKFVLAFCTNQTDRLSTSSSALPSGSELSSVSRYI